MEYSKFFLCLIVVFIFFLFSPLISTTIRVIGWLMGTTYLGCLNNSFWEVLGMIWSTVINPFEKVFGTLVLTCNVNDLLLIHTFGILIEGLFIAIIGLLKRFRWVFGILFLNFIKNSLIEFDFPFVSLIYVLFVVFIFLSSYELYKEQFGIAFER